MLQVECECRHGKMLTSNLTVGSGTCILCASQHPPSSLTSTLAAHTMRIKLDVEKAIQAIGVILREEGKVATRLRILKLLYIADRQALQASGTPILASKLVAMKHGPLHSEVLDLINGKHPDEPKWSHYFSNQGRNIKLAEEPGVGKLSRFEIDILSQAVKDRLMRDDWCVADETHSFEEWIKNYPCPNENTSRPIPIESVIDAVGRGSDKEEILRDLQTTDAFDRFFSTEVGR